MSVTSPIKLVSHNNFGSFATAKEAADSPLGSSFFQMDNLLTLTEKIQKVLQIISSLQHNCQIFESKIVFKKSSTCLVVPAACNKCVGGIQLALFLRNPSSFRYLVPYIFNNRFSNTRHFTKLPPHMARKVTE